MTDPEESRLNEGQIEGLRLMVNEERPITNRQYRELLGVSAATATRDLSELVQKEQTARAGRRRTTRYVAA